MGLSMNLRDSVETPQSSYTADLGVKVGWVGVLVGRK